MTMPKQSELQEKYQLCVDSLTGAGGYWSGEYLTSFIREADKATRVEITPYINNVAGVVESITKPVFANPIKRENLSVQQEVFVEDATGTGLSLTEFLNEVGEYHALIGNVFVIVDNYPETPNTVAEAVENRAVPYVYYKLPTEVYEYEVDKIGRLISVSFFYESRKNPVTGKEEKIYRHIDGSSTYNFTVEQNKRTIVEETLVEYNFGVIPVVMTGSSPFPLPRMYSLCNLAKTIYNQFSEKRNLERNQAFSILTIPGSAPSENVSLGSNNVLWIPPDATARPEFISPDAQILEKLENSIDGSLARFAEAAKRQGAVAITDSAKSGDALKMEFIGTNFVLRGIANVFERVERNLFEVFSLFAGETNRAEVTYDKNYTPSVTQLEAENKYLVEAIAENPSPTATREYLKAYVENVNKLAEVPMDDATLAEINAEIDALPVKPAEQIKALLDLDTAIDSPALKQAVLKRAAQWFGIEIPEQVFAEEVLLDDMGDEE